MRNNKLISIVIPLYNEEESIITLYSELSDSLAGYNFEIIFINDGSSDNSAGVIRGIAEQNSNVKLIRFYKNFGKADALSETQRLTAV